MKTIAVVGTGYWGKNLVRNYDQLGALHTICDTNPSALEQMQKACPGVQVETDFGRLLQNGEIRGVVISLPAALHYQYAKEALLADKDVFVEKPLALKLEQAQELVEIAGRRQRILMVGHLLQYHPGFQKLKQLVSDGVLGKIQYVYSNRLSFGKIRREENSLWSFAPHDISMILSLCGESPTRVSATGGSFLSSGIADVTTTNLEFANGIHAHIFVSWLHPFKEQKLCVVADKKMAVFEDSRPQGEKLAIYHSAVRWEDGLPIAEKSHVEYVPLPENEPLASECRHFLHCIQTREAPLTDGPEGLRVLEVLERAQQSLNHHCPPAREYFAHESCYIDEPCHIGKGTKIWHFSHVLKGAKIGENCNLGQNVSIANDVVIGRNVKIQNNVSVYTGTVIEDDVFLGPSCVLTNVTNPRSQVVRQGLYETTLIRRGATIGANATIVCGTTIGRYAFVAAGAVVSQDVPDYALMVGVPARKVGWMSRHGHRLQQPDESGTYRCPESGLAYREQGSNLVCLDLPEDETLPESMRVGSISYDELKSATLKGAENAVH